MLTNKKIINTLENSIIKHLFSFYILITFMAKQLFLFILQDFYEHRQGKNVVAKTKQTGIK